ncbi:hypothetical protein MMCCUG48898_4760 [Mycobacteroides abscessus subsp. massiliense CCUG 48898 = JCM 15300]|nr:hypothetical protein MMCCUG48898_4760 [Mycobacteroides abscessus subsp. massiliense CCUG 48898 = JCM 15300]BAP99498.1 hypothetical protein MMASJCM_4722 [Mycobacteroides abscessus subsp. massiliense CCUG 48898 = JCM 15300]
MISGYVYRPELPVVREAHGADLRRAVRSHGGKPAEVGLAHEGDLIGPKGHTRDGKSSTGLEVKPSHANGPRAD